MNWNRRSNSRAPLLMRGVLIASIEEIVRVVIVQRVELILGTDAAVQWLTILPELNVGQPSRNAAVAVGLSKKALYFRHFQI